jgi:hypothetical protein
MKKTELKDVIHLYIGCLVQTDYRRRTESGKKMERCVGKLIDIDLLVAEEHFGVQFKFHDKWNSVQLPIKSIKPILRPLSDMTKVEKGYVDQYKNNYHGLSLSESLKVDADITRYLISRKFDMFGLLESEQAICDPDVLGFLPATLIKKLRTKKMKF